MAVRSGNKPSQRRVPPSSEASGRFPPPTQCPTNHLSYHYRGSAIALEDDAQRKGHTLLRSSFWRRRIRAYRLSLILIAMALTVSGAIVWCLPNVFFRSSATKFYPRKLMLLESPTRAVPIISGTPPMPFGNFRKAPMVILEQDYHDDGYYLRRESTPDNDTTGCPYVANWPSSAPLTCNLQHEMTMDVTESATHRLQLIEAGATKEAWRILGEPSVVLKTTSFDHNFVKKTLFKNQKDAIVTEATSASPYIMNMYSYCFFSSLVEAAYGTLAHWLDEFEPKSSSREEQYDPSFHPPPEAMLRAAASLAAGLRDMQMFSESGLPSFAHVDIKAAQFLLMSQPGDPEHPVLKLSDFNRGKFLSASDGKICPFTMPNYHNGNTNRAPEEYIDDGPQTDKVDVFALGSVLYQILTGDPPYQTMKNYNYKKAIRSIVSNVPPPLPEYLVNSTDPNLQAIIRTMTLSRRFKADDRPDSQQVAQMLQGALAKAQQQKED